MPINKKIGKTFFLLFDKTLRSICKNNRKNKKKCSGLKVLYFGKRFNSFGKIKFVSGQPRFISNETNAFQLFKNYLNKSKFVNYIEDLLHCALAIPLLLLCFSSPNNQVLRDFGKKSPMILNEK